MSDPINLVVITIGILENRVDEKRRQTTTKFEINIIENAGVEVANDEGQTMSAAEFALRITGKSDDPTVVAVRTALRECMAQSRVVRGTSTWPWH